MCLLHRVGLHTSYVSHVLPYLLLLGLGFGLSLAPSFSTGTLGLRPHDAGVGSATLNTSQQVGGSIGTALLNTLAAGAATAYLVGRVITPANLQAAALHSYTTAFVYSALIFVVAGVVAGLVLPGGNMRALSGSAPDGTAAEPAPIPGRTRVTRPGAAQHPPAYGAVRRRTPSGYTLTLGTTAFAGCACASAGAGDVVGQCGPLGFELVDTVLHHIADAHDPSQAPSATTGACRIRCSVIMRMTCSSEVSGVTVCTSAV